MATNFPTDDLTTLQLDAATDDPSQARVELLAAVQKIQAIIAATGIGANHSLKLDSNADIPNGTRSAGTVSKSIQDDYSSILITISNSGNVGIGDTTPTKAKLKVFDAASGTKHGISVDSEAQTTGHTIYAYSNSPAHTGNVLHAREDNVDATGALIYGRHDGTGKLLSLNNATSELFSIDNSGNVRLFNNKFLYLGTSNGLRLSHTGTSSEILSYTGGFFIQNLANSQLITYYTRDSGGTDRINMTMGGAIPSVKIFYNGTKEGETLSGSLDGTNDITIAGSTEIVKESKVDWANAGGISQGIIAGNSTESHSLTTSSILIHSSIRIYIPVNANFIEVEFFAKISAGTVNVNVEVGTEVGSIISSFTTSYVSRTMTVDITAISGWQNLQIRAVADSTRTLNVQGTSYRII